MNSFRALICVIDNFGGMADVARAHIKHFSMSPESSSSLVVLSERQSKEHPSERIKYIFANDLHDESEKSAIKTEVEAAVNEFRPDIILLDAMAFPFFIDVDKTFVADTHYLMAVNNSLKRVHASDHLFRTILSNEQDLLFRQTLLQKQMNEKKLFNRASAIICNSCGTMFDLKAYYPKETSSKPVEIIQVKDVIDVPDFLLPSEKERKFAYSGRFNSLKGVDHLIRIAQSIPLQVQAYGVKKEVISELASGYLELANLKLIPWIDDPVLLQQELNLSRFHLFPSYYEPWGLSLTKSLSSGAICIANERGSGHREQIKDGENGFLLDFDASGFMDRLKSIIDMDNTHLDLIASRNALVNKASSPLYVSSILSLLKKVADEKR